MVVCEVMAMRRILLVLLLCCCSAPPALPGPGHPPGVSLAPVTASTPLDGALPRVWHEEDVRALILALEKVRAHGLDPQHYSFIIEWE